MEKSTYVRIKTDLIVPLSQSAVCPEHTHSRSLELGTEAVDDSIKADKDSNDTTVTALENPSSPIFHDSWDCKLLSLGALLHPDLSLSPGFQGVHGGSEPQF